MSQNQPCRPPLRPMQPCAANATLSGLPSSPVKAGQAWSNQKRGGGGFPVLGFLWNLAVGSWIFPSLHPILRSLAPSNYGKPPPEKIVTPIKIKQCILLNLCYALTI